MIICTYRQTAVRCLLVVLCETFQGTLTLQSYRLFMLQWAIDPYDHGARQASLSTNDFPL